MGGDGAPASGWPEASKLLREAYGLTPSQARVALLVALGMSDKKIGCRLGISTSTARHHVAEVRRKLRVTGRSAVPVLLRKFLDQAELLAAEEADRAGGRTEVHARRCRQKDRARRVPPDASSARSSEASRDRAFHGDSGSRCVSGLPRSIVHQRSRAGRPRPVGPPATPSGVRRSDLGPLPVLTPGPIASTAEVAFLAEELRPPFLLAAESPAEPGHHHPQPLPCGR
jgi:DNA-binding CsgD family transcriptional regulator